MNRQSVPDEVEPPATLAPELTEERSEGFGRHVLVWQEGKVKSHLPPARRNGEGGDHGDFLPGSGALVEDRGLADRRPGATQVRRHQKPALIEEDEAGLQPRAVFFTRGHWVLTQPRMAFSSRSRARRSGLCGENPNERSSRPMWSTW